MTNDKPDLSGIKVTYGPLGTHIDQRVTSHNQSGGVTAHTVNVGPQPRHLDEHLKEITRQQVPRDKPVEIASVIGDSEAMYLAMELQEFMNGDGWTLVNPDGVIQGAYKERLKGLVLNDKGDHYALIVGANRP